jgi:hypothetical protein
MTMTKNSQITARAKGNKALIDDGDGTIDSTAKKAAIHVGRWYSQGAITIQL